LKDHGIALGSSLRIVKRNEKQHTLTVKHKRTSVDLPTEVCRTIYVERSTTTA
jgi:Fe2+ transport system protein FeoA